MIDTVTFDLWNTLISNWPLDNQRYGRIRVERIKMILEQNERKVKFNDLFQAYEKGFEKCKEIWRQNLDLSTEEQLKIMFELLEDESEKEIPTNLMPVLVDAFVTPILDEPPPVIDGAREILEQIKKESYKIGLICNTGRTPGKTIRILLERLGMIGYFDFMTFSNEFRIRKPDPRIFTYTLSQLTSLPQNSMHVGDIIELDVRGAKNAGMLSVHFSPDHIIYEQIAPDFTIRHLIELKEVLSNLK
jgi:putative hydrolase of the HAD superfamily